MPQQDTITIFEVVERKAVTEKDPRFYHFTRIDSVRPIFTTDGDALAQFPMEFRVNYIDVPVHRLVRYDDWGRPEKKFVAISPGAEEIFNALFEGERRSSLASLGAERQARRDALERIDSFASLPLLKRIWRAIRKEI